MAKNALYRYTQNRYLLGRLVLIPWPLSQIVPLTPVPAHTLP